MSSLQTAFSAVFPLFCLLGLGMSLRKNNVLDEHALKKMNILAFKVFLSVSVYYNIVTTNMKAFFNGKLIVFVVCSQFTVITFSLIAAFLTEKSNRRRGALAHGIFHVNFVIFGTLIGTSLCGEGNLGSITLLIAIIAPIQNILSVVLLELLRENSNLSFKKTFGGVIKNPYVIAAVLGFATQLSGIRFPSVVSNLIRDVGRCGSPVALIVMGGLFNFSSIRGNLKPIIVGCVTRLLVIPTIMIPIALHLGFVGTDMVGLMVNFAAPCATTSFSLAAVMDSDADLAAQLVVFTSLLSLVTIFGWIYLLSNLGLLV